MNYMIKTWNYLLTIDYLTISHLESEIIKCESRSSFQHRHFYISSVCFPDRSPLPHTCFNIFSADFYGLSPSPLFESNLLYFSFKRFPNAVNLISAGRSVSWIIPLNCPIQMNYFSGEPSYLGNCTFMIPFWGSLISGSSNPMTYLSIHSPDNWICSLSLLGSVASLAFRWLLSLVA